MGGSPLGGALGAFREGQVLRRPYHHRSSKYPSVPSQLRSHLLPPRPSSLKVSLVKRGQMRQAETSVPQLQPVSLRWWRAAFLQRGKGPWGGAEKGSGWLKGDDHSPGLSQNQVGVNQEILSFSNLMGCGRAPRELPSLWDFQPK